MHAHTRTGAHVHMRARTRPRSQTRTRARARTCTLAQYTFATPTAVRAWLLGWHPQPKSRACCTAAPQDA
jgi:hypothetical protein